jgi:hypothetical protein
MERINVMVAMKIAEYYPDDFVIASILDNETNRYSAALWSFKDGALGETLFTFEEFIYKSEDAAIDAMKAALEIAMINIRTMSN